MLREFLYVLILVCGTGICTTLGILPYAEAFLISGVLAVIAMLLVDPSTKAKSSKVRMYLLLLITFYALGLKLPMALLGRVNYYLIYLFVFVLIGIVSVVIFVLAQRRAPSAGE